MIEGAREEILPEVLEFVKEMEVVHIQLDSFKIEDARNLKSYEFLKATEKKKAFVISTNNFLLEAQNTLLKMFEEPIENTHFFLVVPDASALLKTFSSRFYLIKTNEDIDLKDAEKFLEMNLNMRTNFIKELLKEEDVPTESVGKDDSTRSKASKFLNALESMLHQKSLSRSNLDSSASYFQQIFKVRKFLRQPGSSAKSLMESVALVIPVL